jgi:hypothetical protein
MANLADEPIFTDSFESVHHFVPSPQSAYIFADNGEHRSQHIQTWMKGAADVKFVEITDQSFTGFAAFGRTFMLRRSGGLQAFVSEIGASTVYVDITGLLNGVWAPILRALFDAGVEIRATYVEPDGYKRSSAPMEGHIYDLSKEIKGIAPIAGFAVLSHVGAGDFLFVPLLGFEGTRFRYLLEQVQPSNDRILPIIGLPGFKTWYVFETYLGNAPALRESGSWHSARYAAANCPFSCFYLLRKIATDYSNLALKVALIGTKPHALGAIIFALSRSAPVEIVYDNPIRQSGRTSGTSRLFVYHVSSVLPRTPAVPHMSSR